LAQVRECGHCSKLTPLFQSMNYMDYPEHDHNIGYYCGLFPKRGVLAVIAVGFFLTYLWEIVSWVIFARRLAELEALPGSHCYGIRCPSEFSCTFQIETTVLFRYAFEVILGVFCSISGILGAFYWDPKQMKIFGTYLAALAAFTMIICAGDLIYQGTCDAYPSNMISVMPVLSHVKTGRAELAELHMAPTSEVDGIMGYRLGPSMYLWRCLALFCIYAFLAYESYNLAYLYQYGKLGLGPCFRLSDHAGKLHGKMGDFRVDLIRANPKQHHEKEVVGGYGTIEPTVHY